MNTAIFETFGKYKLTERLALGGMAEVFLATVHGEAGFVKPVCIKRLHPRLNEDTEFVQMLIDEARITAQLSHSNICQVLDLGSVDGSYYLAMEFISGEDLRTIQDTFNRSGTPLPIESAIHIVTEMLAGLDYAHRKEGADGQALGIIHRDISPQNVLISYEGEVKIIDFGIAKARLRLVKTEAGVIKGKFRYMSPEQASGARIDHRTDVFAAGVVLYELLRGEPHSMDVADTEVLRRMRRAEFEPLRKTRPEIPPTLEKLVKRALAVKPSARYESAGAFRDALLSFLEKLGVRYGRSELARLMKEVFDIDRRRRRSGSFSGPSQAPREADAGTPIAAASDRVERSEQPTIAASEASAQRQQRKSWVAFAPTYATGSLETEEQEALPPTDPLDALPTTALVVDESEKTTETPLPGSVPGDDQETQAFYSLSDAEIVEVDSDPSVPTAVNPSRPAGTPAQSYDLHRERTDILADRGDAAAQEPPGVQPTLSSGFFARQAETVARPGAAVAPRPVGGERGPDPARRRTLLGVAAVVLFGGVLALTLYLLDRPLDLEESELPDPPLPTPGVSGLEPPDARVPDAARPRRVAKGTIDVQSQPSGAEILLCGASTGERTPAQIRARAGRSCMLELVLPGHDRYRMRVTPRPGRTTTIVATLRRKRRGGGQSRPSLKGRGILRVTSIQVGQVYVNDKRVGSTPRLDLRLLPGAYRVRVYFSNLDRYSRTRTATVRAGGTTRLHVDPAM